MQDVAVNRKWVSKLALAGVGAVLVWGVVTAQRQHRAMTALERDVKALREARQRDPAVVRELRTVVREREAPPTSGAAPAASAAPAQAERDAERVREEQKLTPEEVQYRVDTVVAARDKSYADSYARETPDPTWTEAATAQLRAAFAGPAFAALSLQTDCKSTFCRIVFSYAEPSASEQWRNLRTNMPWPAASNVTVNNDTRQGTMYVAREGYDLPTFDPAAVRF